MKPPGNVMILASAGSGKTYALTNRFVQLLARGAAPERIVALTFTRKAAGELFDAMLRKLAGAAADEAKARKLAAEIQLPGLQSADFLRLLRAVADAMPRLTLGTLDSFFARIVRTFPLELGLGGEFALLEESQARRIRRQVMRRLFQAADGPDAAQREFIEAFKRATFGAEEKHLARLLEDFLGRHAEIYLDAPRAECWGNARRIWPGGCEWLEATAQREQSAAALRAALPWDGLNDRQRERFEAFLAELPGWQPGAPLPPAMKYLLENTLAVWTDLRAGAADITIERRKVTLAGPAAEALAGVVRAVVGAELARRLEKTRGIFAVLRGYDQVYHELVRRDGRLTFADVKRLLLPAAGAPRLSQLAGEERLLIDWRLDAQIDHWLFDEFQDTSYAQWSVLRNLVDEAVQDPGQGRSLFYVGDVKQSIFAWREGDPRLFREIFEHYNRAGTDTITEHHLTTSWRSGPAIIALVNRVFGHEVAVREIAPEGAASRWLAEWKAHATAKPELGGLAELRSAEGEDGRLAETLRILREIEPARRGLTAAVLVQTNETGARIADYLRREGRLAAVAESDLRIAVDNPLTCALLALLRVAAHPGDRLAREHVAMTPLAAVLAREGLDGPDALTAHLLAELHAGGFAATLERWLRKLEPGLAADDQFSRLRGRQLVDAAREFDENGRRDVAEFLDWAAGCTAREAVAAGVVRVLTIHKAKGLDFDVVILPDLGGQSLDRRRDGLAVQRNRDRSANWVLEMPQALFFESDEILRTYAEAAEADAAYEALCKLYVAMTRAKRAMYLVAEPARKSRSRNFPKLLELALGDERRFGDPAWFAPLASAEVATGPDELVRLPVVPAGRRARLAARRPSEAGPAERPVALFAREKSGAADFGAEVHRLFETLGWWSAADEPGWREARQAEGAGAAAVEEVLRCVQHPQLQAVFGGPPAGARVDLWRERAFEVILDGVWVTGVFDRVRIDRNAAGKAVGAWVVDFKTDRPAGADPDMLSLERHAGQLNLYRRVAAILAGVPENQVRCSLLMSAGPRLLDVPRPA